MKMETEPHKDHLSQVISLFLVLSQGEMKVPDAIIAATAIEQKVPLLTFDKDFAKVREVDLVLLEN